MAWLYLARELELAPAPGDRVAITGDEARHAATVARVRVGERISVGNGHGLVAEGAVVAAAPSEVIIEVASSRVEPAPAPALWLAQALAKGGRDESAIQAATELGVSGVIPWAAERSVSRWTGPKVAKGEARWAAITAEAAKQAVRAWVPELAPLATTTDLARQGRSLLVLDPTAPNRLTEAELPGETIVLVVGPEGGISPRELAAFDDAGATRVRLGAEILRTSTAGPAALAILNARRGRW